MFILPPNCIVPSATSLTISPVFPSFLYLISDSPSAPHGNRESHCDLTLYSEVGGIIPPERLCAVFLITFFFGPVIGQLSTAHTLDLDGSSLEETTRLDFEGAGLLTKRAHEPYGHAMHETP